jgi:hypothetical protein
MGKKWLVPLNLTPDIRLQKALKISEDGKNIPQELFELHDPKSTERIVRELTGLRFSEDNGKWEAKLTFKPSVDAPFDFEEVLKIYRKGKPAPFLPGTIISGFVFSATPSYIPRQNAAGWFSTFGVNEDGSLEELHHTAVSPYLPSANKNRFRRNKKGGQKSSGGIAYGLAKLTTISDLVAIKKQIALNLKLSGRDPKKPNKGDNRKLWDKLNNCSETFREQLSAQVLRLALRVEGRLQPQGKLNPEEVSQPKKVKAWFEKYPEAKHLLVVPAPMGSSHQSFRGKAENKLVHTIGVAEIYRKILEKSCYSRVSTTFVTKTGMWNTNPFTGEAIKGTDKGAISVADWSGKTHLLNRGQIGTTNLVRRLFKPLTKKIKEAEEVFS